MVDKKGAKPDSLFGFLLNVPLSGYWWTDFAAEGVTKASEPVLMHDEAAHVRTYNPMREARGLFLILAETPPEPDAILAFANRYGNLGEGIEQEASEVFGKDASRLKLPLPPGWVANGPKVAGKLHGHKVETLSAWQEAIRFLHDGVLLWRYVQAGGRSPLPFDELTVLQRGVARMLRDTPLAGMVGGLEPGERDVLKELRELGLLPEGVRSGPQLSPVFRLGFYLSTYLNDAIRELASPYLLCRLDGKFQFSFEVRSLWGAVLLQFMQAIGESRDYQQCAACSRWFELAPSVSRSDRTTCSDSCRQKIHKLRKERAFELHAAGKTPAAIAKEIGSDTQTVKNWIARRKGK